MTTIQSSAHLREEFELRAAIADLKIECLAHDILWACGGQVVHEAQASVTRDLIAISRR